MDKQLREKRDKLIKEMPSFKEVIRGSLMTYYLTCGNPKCKCHKSSRYRHGPYHYLQVKTKGKNKMYYLHSSSMKEKVAYGISRYNKLWSLLCKVSEINIKLIKKGGK